MIAKKEEYVDLETGAQVTVLNEVQKKDTLTLKKPVTEFIGSGSLMTPNGRSFQIQFEILADDLNEAFEKFEESAQKRIEEIKKEAEESNRIVGADGNPISKPEHNPGLSLL